MRYNIQTGCDISKRLDASWKKKIVFSQQWQPVPKSMGTDPPSETKTQGGKKRGGSLDLL